MIERVHLPECNVWCNERGHWLLSSGPQGEPFSHQDAAPPAEEDAPVEAVRACVRRVAEHPDGRETL